MKRVKESYCKASFLFAFAVFVFVAAAVFFRPAGVHAAQTDPAAGQETSADTEDADARNDNADGFSIIYNNDSGSLSTPVRMLLVLTILSLAPSILVMLTSFTRIIIVLHFVRTAIGTQTAPPNQVLVGLSLFLTFFIMWPTFQEINENALKPLEAGTITQEEALQAAEEPLREFMVGQTQARDLEVFVEISGEEYENYDEVPFTTLVPAFILSELRTSFIIGFLIYIPFIVIDMVVASVLMSMGMMMLPPTVISLPFKILLFVLADGWDLVIEGVVQTFY